MYFASSSILKSDSLQKNGYLSNGTFHKDRKHKNWFSNLFIEKKKTNLKVVKNFRIVMQTTDFSYKAYQLNIYHNYMVI